MKFQILGTAAAEGWPALFCHCDACEKARQLGEIRTRNQAIINDDLLIDFPGDTYYHAIKENLDLSKVKTLIITHSHSDHFAPIDLMLRGSCYASKMAEKELFIFSNEECKNVFDSVTKREILPEVTENIHYQIVEPFVPFQNSGYTIHPLKANHAPKEASLLYLIEKDGKTIFYCTDTGALPQETYDYLEGKRIDLVAYDSTFGPKNFENGHLGIENADEIHQKLVKLGCVDESTIKIVTHFSHNCGALSHQELKDFAGQFGFLTAYDGFCVEF